MDKVNYWWLAVNLVRQVEGMQSLSLSLSLSMGKQCKEIHLSHTHRNPSQSPWAGSPNILKTVSGGAVAPWSSMARGFEKTSRLFCSLPFRSAKILANTNKPLPLPYTGEKHPTKIVETCSKCVVYLFGSNFKYACTSCSLLFDSIFLVWTWGSLPFLFFTTHRGQATHPWPPDALHVLCLAFVQL